MWRCPSELNHAAPVLWEYTEIKYGSTIGKQYAEIMDGATIGKQMTRTNMVKKGAYTNERLA